MDFFIPGIDDPTDTLIKMRADGVRPIYSVTYLHDGDRYTATAGEQRMVFKRRTGPRGGYIKDAEPAKHGASTGSTVLLIVRTATLIEVWSEPPFRGWANPSLIGLGEVEDVTYFDDA